MVVQKYKTILWKTRLFWGKSNTIFLCSLRSAHHTSLIFSQGREKLSQKTLLDESRESQLLLPSSLQHSKEAKKRMTLLDSVAVTMSDNQYRESMNDKRVNRTRLILCQISLSLSLIHCCWTSFLWVSFMHIESTIGPTISDPRKISKLAPSDFHLFCHLKHQLRRKMFRKKRWRQQ